MWKPFLWCFNNFFVWTDSSCRDMASPGKRQKCTIADIVKSVMKEECASEKFAEFLQVGDVRKGQLEECVSFALGNYGYDTVMNVIETAKSVPSVLPEKIWVEVCKEVSGQEPEQFESVYHFLRNKCPFLLSSTKTSGRDLKVLAPPTGHCLKGCKDRQGCPLQLVLNNKPCDVRFFSGLGPSKKLKVCLKCWKCCTTYNFCQFGNCKEGFRFYDTPRDAIEASDVTIVDRDLFELQCSLA